MQLEKDKLYISFHKPKTVLGLHLTINLTNKGGIYAVRKRQAIY
nr:MAG TPA: hypothetical protein [Caudoviricetes sp.]